MQIIKWGKSPERSCTHSQREGLQRVARERGTTTQRRVPSQLFVSESDRHVLTDTCAFRWEESADQIVNGVQSAQRELKEQQSSLGTNVKAGFAQLRQMLDDQERQLTNRLVHSSQLTAAAVAIALWRCPCASDCLYSKHSFSKSLHGSPTIVLHVCRELRCR